MMVIKYNNKAGNDWWWRTYQQWHPSALLPSFRRAKVHPSDPQHPPLPRTVHQVQLLPSRVILSDGFAWLRGEFIKSAMLSSTRCPSFSTQAARYRPTQSLSSWPRISRSTRLPFPSNSTGSIKSRPPSTQWSDSPSPTRSTGRRATSTSWLPPTTSPKPSLSSSSGMSSRCLKVKSQGASSPKLFESLTRSTNFWTSSLKTSNSSKFSAAFSARLPKNTELCSKWEAGTDLRTPSSRWTTARAAWSSWR